MNEYKYEDIQIGDEESFDVEVTKEMLDSFKDITGDINPLHNDDEYAKEQGFDAKVAYGMLSASFLSTLAGVYMPGKYSLIQNVSVEFPRPVFVGEKLTITGKVTEKNDVFKFIVLKVLVKNEKGEKKVKGNMRIGVIKWEDF